MAKARIFLLNVQAGLTTRFPGLKSGATSGPAFFRSLFNISTQSEPENVAAT